MLEDVLDQVVGVLAMMLVATKSDILFSFFFYFFLFSVVYFSHRMSAQIEKINES